MGRKKTYDREDVARKAMELFWLRGFHGTTTDALVEHMGVNRFSLFAEFESKQGLFEAALELYEREVVTRHFGTLEEPDATLDDVRKVVSFFAASAGDGSERGCFLCNTATERAPHDKASKAAVGLYLDRITAGLHNALSNSQVSGELRADVAVEDEARWLAATLLGFWVLFRAQADPSFVRGAARAALRHLSTLGEADHEARRPAAR